MSAYATAERAILGTAGAGTDMAHVGEILNRFIDVLADRVAERLAEPDAKDEGWLDTREAAEYLRVHRDTVRRLAAERSIPSEQDGPGCKLFFRRSDLDAWRSGAGQLRLVGGASR